MKLKVQQVMDATIVLTRIVNDRRPMPQRGKYLVARMHAKLLPEFKIIDGRRDEMIRAYNNPQTRVVPGSIQAEGESPQMEPIEGQWQVPADKMPEFTEAWKAIGAEEIDVDVQAIPLLSLSLPDGSDGAIEANELITLGDLVFDSAS